ncbi:hypothetical protein CEUSTIGMA_g12651.t1 [Chlamydomonas eustigma]|uniref:Uncharacterized protein n=1 Tax=Chlamydomonas eustigma TaxID=1157962 RepID=A0A250XQ69_9CHLO|nr:hypothetical protein CEUSTIGMA_g12651.t1 [Chlamydomonas eustigma]|eukprot:GAX85231.1 hypothetical protein CEUSTIGMA_g12651.t1 [Chlamydomonas eustigma]
MKMGYMVPLSVTFIYVSALLIGMLHTAEAKNQMGMSSIANMTNRTAPCNSPGFYHLSCYKGVDAAAALAAKTQCLAVWETTNTSCQYGIDASGSHSYRCDVYVVYHFSTQACHNSYQDHEKTNTACTQYDTAKLGANVHRLKPDVKANYQCS